MVAGLNESVELFRLFRVEGRTSLSDLLPALLAMDERLEKYDRLKGGAWRRQSVDTHLVHAIGHLSRAVSELEEPRRLVKELAGCGLRVLFALTCFLKRDDPSKFDSLSSVRADTTEV